MGNPRRKGSDNTAAAAAAGDDIHTAARNGDIMAVQSMCLSNPLAVNSRDRHSRTPLHLAAWSGQTEVVRYLCNNKADVGAAAMDNMGAIHFASQKGHTEIIRILLSSGVSVKATNRKGFMPLHYAIQGSHLDLIKYLVRKGASLSAKTKAGKTPLDLASDEVRAFVLECELSFKNEGETKCNEELATKETVEEGEAVEHEQNDEAGHDEGEKRKIEVEEGEAVEHEHNDEPGYDEGEKRKVEAPEEDDTFPNPKKAKVVLSHLVAADDDLQEDE